jgi:hypothetical protein
MEGKHDEVLVCKHAARNSKDAKGPSARNKGTNPKTSAATAATTGKPGGLWYDTSSHAYLLDSETHQAIYVASPPEPSKLSTSSTEFVGLASDSITPAFIHELSAADEDKYTMLMAAIDPLTTSLDWHSNTCPVDFTSITYKAPNQHRHTIVDPSIIPMFLNCGASVYISNDESDFFSLCLIPPHSVNGVGGSSIQAVGISTMYLVVARGIHITLDNVLFIPMVMVRLISISALCIAHQCITLFNTTTCWVQACSSSRMLSGTLTSYHLYALSGVQLSGDHAYLANQLPTLQSWHCHLSHANYRAIYDLMCSGYAIGMPIDLSAIPPKCDHCILGKQTKTSMLKTRAGDKASRKLVIIHVDLMEHPDTVSAASNKCIMDIIDDHSSYAWAISRC